GPQADRVRQDIVQTDPRARACLGASLSQGHMKDELAMLARAAVPVALLAAGDDAFLDPGYHASLPADRLWGGQVIQCPAHGHALHLLAPQRVADTLTDFLFSSQPCKSRSSFCSPCSRWSGTWPSTRTCRPSRPLAGPSRCRPNWCSRP